MILGITGTDGGGKGAVVDFLVKEKGFVHCSARAIFLEEIERRGLEASRENLRVVANDLRREYGNDFLVTHYLKYAQREPQGNLIIESIRTLAEADTLRKNGGMLIVVDADPEIRYARITSRGSSSDHVTYEQFLAHEALEMNDPDPHGMQKAKVMESADYSILNNGTLEELHQKVGEMIEILAQQSRI